MTGPRAGTHSGATGAAYGSPGDPYVGRAQSPPDPPTGTYPGAVPYPPPPPSQSPAETPVDPDAPLPPGAVFVQRLLGGALMLVLLSMAAVLWGFGGTAFRVLFTCYVGWVFFWMWTLFVKRPTI